MLDAELRRELALAVAEQDVPKFRTCFDTLRFSDEHRFGLSNVQSAAPFSEISPEIWVLFGEAAVQVSRQLFTVVV